MLYQKDPATEEELKECMFTNLARLHSTDDKGYAEMYKLIKDSYMEHHVRFPLPWPPIPFPVIQH